MASARTFFKKANGSFSVGLAATLLASSSFIASGLGLYREKLLYRGFYDHLPSYLDAYQAAFRIPDFMFFVLVSGALSVTFIPVFNARLAKNNRKSAWELSSSLFNMMAVITMIASVLIMIFADPLIRYIVAPGLPEDVRGLAVAMMRIIAINPFLFALSSVLTSMQQAVGRFFFFTLAPIVYNIGIITGILFFTNEISMFGHVVWEGGIMGVALGVVFGSILQLIVSSLGMIGLKFDYKPLIFWKNKGFKKVLKLLPPRSFDQGIDYFSTLVETNIASRLGSAAIAQYQLALTLHLMPINLIGVAISTAFFPKMTQRMETGQLDLFKKELQTVLRVIIWIALPVCVIAYLCRGYLVGLIKTGGEPVIAAILGFLVVAILFRSIYQIASRAFYAQQDTKTPLYISLVAITLNIILALTFYKMGLGLRGLAMAQSIVAFVEVVMLLVIIRHRLNGLFDRKFWNGVVRMLSATGLTYLVTYIMVQFVPFQATDVNFFAVLTKLIIIVIITFSAYLYFSHLLRLSEPKPILAKLQKILFPQTR